MASATKHKQKTRLPEATAKARPKQPSNDRAANKPTGKKSATATFAGLESPERSAPPMAEVDADVLEFIEALDRFKKQHGRPFPSWSEVLLVVRQLGYVRK